MLYVATYDGRIRSIDDKLEEKNIFLDYYKIIDDHITSIDRNEKLICMTTLSGNTLFLDHEGELERQLGTVVPNCAGIGVVYHKNRFYVLNQNSLSVYDGKGRTKDVRPIKEKASCLSVGEEVLVGTEQNNVYRMDKKRWDLFAEFNLPVMSIGQSGGKVYFGLGNQKQGMFIAGDKMYDLPSFPVIYCNDNIYVSSRGKIHLFSEEKTAEKNVCRERISCIRKVDLGNNTFLAAAAGRRLYLFEDDLDSKIVKIFSDVITTIR